MLPPKKRFLSLSLSLSLSLTETNIFTEGVNWTKNRSSETARKRKKKRENKNVKCTYETVALSAFFYLFGESWKQETQGYEVKFSKTSTFFSSVGARRTRGTSRPNHRPRCPSKIGFFSSSFFFCCCCPASVVWVPFGGGFHSHISTQPSTVVYKMEAQLEYILHCTHYIHVFCTFGTDLYAQSVLINKISASELSRKFIESALLAGWG